MYKMIKITKTHFLKLTKLTKKQVCKVDNN
jgi:hypothetical protein